jgi:hypothetical protein
MSKRYIGHRHLTSLEERASTVSPAHTSLLSCPFLHHHPDVHLSVFCVILHYHAFLDEFVPNTVGNVQQNVVSPLLSRLGMPIASSVKSALKIVVTHVRLSVVLRARRDSV